VVRDVSSKLKRAIGKGAYVLETLRQLVVYKSKFYDVRVDGVAMRAASLLVCNGHYYGGRFVAAPQARLENPDLQVVLFQRKGRFAILRYTLALALGRLPTREDVRIVSARTIEIDGPAGEPVQGDGDIVAHLPARFEAMPDAAILVGPPG
jgi:diacylglycerol kinase family enzyme